MMHKSKGCIVCAAAGFNYIGGMELYAHNLLKYLYKSGWETHCLATNYIGDNYQIKVFVHTFNDLSKQSLSPKKVFHAADIINKINPDILLLNHCPLAQYTLPLLSQTIKPVAILHSDDPRFYQTATIFKERVFRWIAPTAGVARGVSGYLGADHSNRVCIIPHGINNELFHARQSEFKSVGEIAFVGYIAPNKGADLLEPIMKQVVLKYPQCHITMVGYGPLQERLTQQFKSSGMEKNLTMTGKVFPEKVADILKRSDIFLLPTRIEGFGLAIAEAMMSGAVPVVSRLAGITDTIIADHETGILVEVDHVEGFSSAIIDLLSNPDRLAVMKRAARKYAEENFTFQRMIDDYEKLFAETDDRSAGITSGRAGWFPDVFMELIRRNPDGSFRFQKKLGTFRGMLLPSEDKAGKQRY